MYTFKLYLKIWPDRFFHFSGNNLSAISAQTYIKKRNNFDTCTFKLIFEFIKKVQMCVINFKILYILF